jgi:hypothetical protein
MVASSKETDLCSGVENLLLNFGKWLDHRLESVEVLQQIESLETLSSGQEIGFCHSPTHPEVPYCRWCVRCAQSMCVFFILPMLRALSCWTFAAASVVSALDSPIWGRGEEWIAKKLNKDQNATAPEDSCILGEQWGCNDDEVAAGLTNQIISELNGMGYSFSGLDSNWVHCSFPCYLQSGAASNLVSAAQSVNDYITLNSAFRSSAQQYLLYRWYNNGMCGIGLAAAPGTSNHESGRAIDTSYYNYWLNTLQNYGWAHNYPSNDPVHFDYTNVPDISSQNLLAFQRLWNRNNPGSRIDEDGIYGPQTSNALYWSPCGGW